MSWATDLYPDLSYWRDKTFPGHSIVDAALKLGEESGEVQACIFKIRWSDNPVDWANQLPKEIGDAGLVLLSLCEMEGLDFCRVIEDRAREKGMLE